MHAVNSFPVLHFPGRPQRESVSKTLLWLLKTKVARVEAQQYHEDEGLEIARGEDEWEDILADVAGYEDPDLEDEDDETTWLRDAGQGLNYLKREYDVVRRKTVENIQKFQERIDRETEEYEKRKLMVRTERRRRERKRKALMRAFKNGKMSEKELKSRIQTLYNKPKSGVDNEITMS